MEAWLAEELMSQVHVKLPASKHERLESGLQSSDHDAQRKPQSSNSWCSVLTGSQSLLPLPFGFALIIIFTADKLTNFAGWHILVAEKLHLLFAVILIF